MRIHTRIFSKIREYFDIFKGIWNWNLFGIFNEKYWERLVPSLIITYQMLCSVNRRAAFGRATTSCRSDHIMCAG